jgi:hypothetical protein
VEAPGVMPGDRIDVVLRAADEAKHTLSFARA